MRKLVSLTLAAATAFMLYSCAEKPDELQLPQVLDASFSSLVHSGTDEGDVNVIKLTSKSTDATFSVNFYTDKRYLPSGSYRVGTEPGTFSGHYKNPSLDNNVVSGTLKVSGDEEGNYTISGSLRLDDKEGTIIKVSAAGNMEFPKSSEYFYTAATSEGVTTYNIYSLGSENILLARAIVGGNGNGKYTVSSTLDAGTADYNSFYFEGESRFVMLSGNITVQEESGNMTFVFEYDGQKATFSNCEKKESITETLRTGEDTNSEFSLKTFVFPSGIKDGTYDYIVKVYFKDGREFFSATIHTSSETPLADGAAHNYKIRNYATYATGAAADHTSVEPATYYVLNGETIPAPLGLYITLREGKNGDLTRTWVLLSDPSEVMPEPLNTFLGGNKYAILITQ